MPKPVNYKWVYGHFNLWIFLFVRAESLDLYSSFQTDQTENAKKAIPTASISDQGKNVFYINININK